MPVPAGPRTNRKRTPQLSRKPGRVERFLLQAQCAQGRRRIGQLRISARRSPPGPTLSRFTVSFRNSFQEGPVAAYDPAQDNKVANMKKPFILATAALLGVTAGNATAAAKIDFAKQVQPIFEQSCIKCHGADKHKGDLRLDLKDAAFKGGKDGPVIVVGDAAKSDLYRRITLPEGSDDVMPNKGDVLSKAQTDLIRDWINQGANWPADAVAKASSSEPSALEVAKLGDIKPSAAEIQATARLDGMGVAVRPLAAGLNWHEASFRSCDAKSTDAAVVQLKDMLTLMDLNLAGMKFSDASLASLKGLTNLTRLHLEHSSVTDAGLANVQRMARLVYLNLFDTGISDAGLEHLKTLGQLRHLYVWQTKVTDTGVAALQKALPQCEIVRGWDISPVAEKAKDTKDAKDAKDAKTN